MGGHQRLSIPADLCCLRLQLPKTDGLVSDFPVFWSLQPHTVHMEVPRSWHILFYLLQGQVLLFLSHPHM